MCARSLGPAGRGDTVKYSYTLTEVEESMGNGESSKKKAVRAYIEGFRTGDHEAILSLLTDDVTWEIPGFFDISGKDAFDNEIENDAFEGHPKLTIRLL